MRAEERKGEVGEGVSACEWRDTGDSEGGPDRRERAGGDFSLENPGTWGWESSGVGSSPHHTVLTKIYTCVHKQNV